MHTFTNWGKNMPFPSFFHSLSIIFFPNLLFGHIFVPPGGGVKQKNIHPCFCISFTLNVHRVQGGRHRQILLRACTVYCVQLFLLYVLFSSVCSIHNKHYWDHYVRVQGGTHGHFLLRACTVYISDSEPDKSGSLPESSRTNPTPDNFVFRTIVYNKNLNIFFSRFLISHLYFYV